MHRILAFLTLVAVVGTARAQDDGFKPLFNGKDLTGWYNVNCAPSTWFVKDNMIITTGKPTGYLRTDKQYENFILEFDWLHAPNPKGSVGNSGLFVWGDPIPAVGTGYTRSIEVQVLVNLNVKDTYTSQGDLFSIWGAKCKPDRPHPKGWERCLPSEDRCKGEFEWNHYKAVANNGVLKLHVNGKEVSGVHESNPRKGYLALESEGSECRFKNLKIKELPSTNPKASEICDVDKGWKCLFTGLDLAGWKATDEHKAHWKMGDGVLIYDGKAKGESELWSTGNYGDFELVCDWRGPGSGDYGIKVRGSKTEEMVVLRSDKKANDWNRSIIRLQGNRVTLRTNNKIVVDDMPFPNKLAATGAIALSTAGPAVQFRNVFIRELKKDE
ncbi:MAG: DUF1080 domain-containing protein [Gemmataceae bacterium]|nr:DUF1080 domain-containing protein [Gemmataceae bacterium]